MQKLVGFIIFFILLTGTYYWFIIDESRINQMSELENSDIVLSGDVNSTLEIHDRLELKWIGTSKHVKILQDETSSHYKSYFLKMDSIDVAFQRMALDIEQLGEILNQKIDRMNDEIRNLSDSFDSYKRTANRNSREIKQDLSILRDDLNTLDKQLNPKKYEENNK